ncbi:exodeoxyribonuclease VII small subunit [Verrucomicrobiaceae bacterium R5-34]|nr:exodeoxyribonuclease VII small subunit [Verrucomicrobiaceae bacterium R5-34]
MPSSPKKKNDTSTDSAPSFEQALEELEDMVETMESGQLPLEKLIANYERGAELIGHCETVLDDARKRLELITLKPKASATETTHESTQDEAPTSTTSNNNNDDEIRLF